MMRKRTAVNYPIGTVGQTWQAPEKAQWLQTRRVHRSYHTDVVEPLLKFADASNAFELKQYGVLDVDSLPLFAAVPFKPSENKPWVLVTGGTHGYETSGVLGALRFLFQAEKYLIYMNVVVVPCVCPWGYERIERWVSTAVDPNRSFGRPFVETEIDMTVRTRETMMLMKYLDSIVTDDNDSVNWLCHLDLHETTDTDSTEFCPAKAARDGDSEYDAHIPDGFYIVGDTVNSKLDWYRAIIAAVEKVTHIAPADEDNTIIGEPVVSPGIILVPKKKLGLCAGGAVPGAAFIVTTEVYPDSAKTNPEECILAQVESVCAAFDYLLEHEIGHDLQITVRRADENDFDAIKQFHVANHLTETCHFPGERERQVCDLQDDFPQLCSIESFRRGRFWVAIDANDCIVGSIGLLPDENEPETTTWLNTFSVANHRRGRKIGSRLFAEALDSVNTERLRLVTLGGHSKGIDVMRLARRMYEKNEFVLYQSKTVSYGDDTSIDLMYYEKKMS